MNSDQRLGIGALSERTAVNIETIRFYERVGLLPAPNEHRERLVFIQSEG